MTEVDVRRHLYGLRVRLGDLIASGEKDGHEKVKDAILDAHAQLEALGVAGGGIEERLREINLQLVVAEDDLSRTSGLDVNVGWRLTALKSERDLLLDAERDRLRLLLEQQETEAA